MSLLFLLLVFYIVGENCRQTGGDLTRQSSARNTEHLHTLLNFDIVSIIQSRSTVLSALIPLVMVLYSRAMLYRWGLMTYFQNWKLQVTQVLTTSVQRVHPIKIPRARAHYTKSDSDTLKHAFALKNLLFDTRDGPGNTC
jgi:hypothetical protein